MNRGILIAAAFVIAAVISYGGARDDAAGRAASGNTRTESFDRDPGWDGHNNRAVAPEPMRVVQDFGYRPPGPAGDGAGQVGGILTPAAEPAYYGKVLPDRGLNDVLTASGKLRIARGGGHVLLGFFNAGTVNEWRTPNTLALRFGGEGDRFAAYLEYATSRWRAGGALFTTPKPVRGDARKLFPFPAGDATHAWSIKYDPKGNGGGGTLTATVDDQTVTADLAAGHKADGATFNRFGLLNMMRHADDQAGSVWISDVRLNGRDEPLDRDPEWEGFQNRRTYTTADVRPRFDFGYSPTGLAGGRAPGEMGGLIFRGDRRYPDRMAYYGDRLENLSLDKPLNASGKVTLRQGVTDSMGLIGFFHSVDSVRPGKGQASVAPENFLGVAVEGPSDEGFFVYPYYGTSRPDRPPDTSLAPRGVRQHIYPDGKPHDWTLAYVPADAAGQPRITVTLDGRPYGIAIPAEDKAAGARFDRFGIVTTGVDGNGMKLYFDDLTYTFRQ